MFNNQTSLKGFSTFSTISLAFSIASVIHVELTTKKAVMKKKLQLSLKLIIQNQSVTRPLVSQNWSVTLTVIVKKRKISTLTLILTKQLT